MAYLTFLKKGTRKFANYNCPDVEFVQLARPTLSLAKYLQQVGRGLRKSDNKESCVLIDNVGLHRIFGLPVRDRDWEAMFEGRMAGNAQPWTRMENSGLSVSCSLSEDSKLSAGCYSERGFDLFGRRWSGRWGATDCFESLS